MKLKFPNTFDRFIIKRFVFLTLVMILLLVCIFILIDFSENSDDFSDRGAKMAEIWGDYYLNYIPEMVRLISPVALFVAALLITGQLSDRLELIALKASGISIYRIFLPYLVVGIFAVVGLHYLDGYIVPKTNTIRVQFERRYINRKSDRIDRNKLFRQNTPNSILQVNYFEPVSKVAYTTNLYDFKNDSLVKETSTVRMKYIDSTKQWHLFDPVIKVYTDSGIVETKFEFIDTVLNVLPRDLARTEADINLLTYPEVRYYLESIQRSGAGKIEVPLVQYLGKLFYPISVPIVLLIGISLASVRRKGGKGIYLGIGLGVSFAYLVLMKLAEPLGSNGVIEPLYATLIPHFFFFIITIFIIWRTKT